MVHMNAKSSTMESENSSKWKFWIVSLALFTGLILSILSWLEICVEHCSANQDYRLFGIPFAIFGITFFIVLNGLHIFSKKHEMFSRLIGWMIVSALGAELMFIIVQKYEIGHLCPVCLSIAGTIFIAALALSVSFFEKLKKNIQLQNRGETMKIMRQALTSLTFFVFGFLMAFIGVGKPDLAEASMNEMKEKIAFGTKNSPVEVYFITDWYCPSCKKIEPMIEKILPELNSKVTFYFIDYPIHKKSLNFSPYNISFLVNNKPQYFKARNVLMELTEKTESPREEDVSKAAQKHGIIYKSLSFLDVKSGLDFFDSVVEKYKLHATPTIIITNPRRNTNVILEGRDEISEEKILNAIKKMTPSQ